MIYVLTYFRTEDEALHVAWSEDGLHWCALRGNQAVARSPVGTKTVRDPFVRPGADGGYHLVATDGWSGAGFVHARSRDLAHWDGWRVCPVMAHVAGAKNVWAPEFVFDEDLEAYVVVWSSVAGDKPYQRIWWSRTTDFSSYSPPQVLFDPGFSVIDATLVHSGGRWYLCLKDERGENRAGTDYKAMRMAASRSLLGPYSLVSDLVTPPLTEGPAVFRARDRWLMLYDCFLDGHWGAAESTDLVAWREAPDVCLPQGARHGSAFAVPRAEFARLSAALKG